VLFVIGSKNLGVWDKLRFIICICKSKMHELGLHFVALKMEWLLAARYVSLLITASLWHSAVCNNWRILRKWIYGCAETWSDLLVWQCYSHIT
jgi:hypothetical protein